MKKQLITILFLSIIAGIFLVQETISAATLGSITPGSLSTSSPNTLVASRIIGPNENGTLTSLSAYFTSAAAAPNNLVQLAIYADNAGAPGALVTSTATQAITPNSWTTVSAAGTLTANTTYWLAVNTNGASAISYNTSVANASYYHSQTFGTMPNPFGAATGYAISLSIYATYTPSGGTPPPPPPPPPPPGSWVPPIGIPAPEFGINETVASLHGGDANFRTKTVSGGGSLNTLMPALVPGDVLVIESGAYTVTGGTTWNHTGTVTNPIIVRGQSSTTKPIIAVTTSQNNLHLSGSYVIYENLDFNISALGDTGVDLTGNHISFRNSEIRNGIGSTHTALFVGGTYNVAFGNRIHDNGTLGGAGDIDFHGMGAAGDHHWIVDNEIYRNAGDGIQLNPGNAANARSLHHIYVGRNDAWGNQQAGFWIKFSEDIIFSQNKSHGHRPSDSSSGQGMGFQYGSERVWFLFNEIYNNTQGILIASDGGPGGNGNGQDAYFIGNVVRNNSGEGLISWETSSRKHVVNNTIYGSAIGIDFFNARQGTEIVNNVISNVSGTDIDLSSNGGGTFSNNLCDTACAMVAATCASCVAGNLAFIDADGADNIIGNADDNLGIQSNSAAIDVGTVSSVYQTFQTLYGLNIAVDYANTSRPAGSAWDIGAYEFGGPVTPPPPPPPAPSTYSRTINIASLQGRTTRVVSGTLDVLSSPGKTLLASYPFTTDTSGNATVTFNVPLQTVYLKTNVAPFLDRVIQVDLTNTSTYNFPQLYVGDINQDNFINSVDYSVVNTNWFTSNTSGDLNQDGFVNSIDFSYMNTHWLMNGES